MTIKYLVWACAFSLLAGSCTASAPPITPSPTAAAAAPTASPSPTAVALAVPVPVREIALDRLWYTVPDPFAHEPALASVEFDGDPSVGMPRARIDPSSKEVPLVRTSGTARWSARIDLTGLAPGEYTVGIVERVAGADAVVGAKAPLRLSAPEYVAWTLDFEGDEASDATMANTAAIAGALTVPMTLMWNPRAWTSAAVTPEGAAAMLAWTKARAAAGDEVALHLHMWADYVQAAGVPPRLLPRWAGRGDGYDVPITAYTEAEQRALVDYGLRLMAEHGLVGVTSFRAGGTFGDAATLRALAANGITADATAVGAGTWGSLRLPWTLTPDAQPYVPSREDANRTGDLPLIEAPTNGGNTYGYTVSSIASIVRADLAMLAKGAEIAKDRRGLVIVSHPGTIDATERAAIETLLHAFDPFRYDRDRGPLRFVTLRQLAQAWR